MNISKRYCIELNKIGSHLADLEEGTSTNLPELP